MNLWTERSPVEKAMLNPALIALCLAHSADGYQRVGRSAMPWPVAFLVPPLVLHKPTRDALPANARSHFTNWAGNNPRLVIGFPRRAQAMCDPTREGLRVAIRHGLVSLDGGFIRPRTLRPARQGEIRDILKDALLVGRLLGSLDQPSTAFSLLGVAP